MRGRLPVDAPTFVVLAAIAVVLFGTVRFPPDLTRGRTVAPPSVAAAPPARVQDFAYVFNYARRAAQTPGVSPYSLASHERFLDAWLGPRVRSALCFAYGPAMVLLLRPLFAMSTAHAWLVWNLLGVVLVTRAVRGMAPGDALSRHWTRLAVTGTTAFHCLVNGQTALLTTGIVAAAVGGVRPAAPLVTVAGLAALSAKPPLAIVVAVALLLAGRARAVGVGFALIGALVLAAFAYWTPSIAWDYAALVGRYNLVDAYEVMRAGLAPWSMTNLRAMLLRVPGIDDSRAFFASGWTFAAALVVPLVVVAARGRAWPREVAASVAIMVYLLFSPHLSTTEDVLLVVPLALLTASGRVRGRARAALVVACVAPQWANGATLLLLSATRQPGWEAALPVALFALKCLAAAVVARVALRPAAT